MVVLSKPNRIELKRRYGNEEVLVIPKSKLPALADGFTKAGSYVFKNLFEEDTYFIKRWRSDYNPQEVEIIPYPIITNEDGNKFFCSKRIEGSNEERLVGNLSLGIGGHVNPAKGMEGLELLNYSLERELSEELMIIPSAISGVQPFPRGLIRVKESSVDRDHLGLLYQVSLKEEYYNDLYVKIRETDTLEGSFETYEYLKNNYDKLETWSQIVIDNI